MLQDYLNCKPHSDSYETLSGGHFHHTIENFHNNQDFFSAFSDSGDQIGLYTHWDNPNHTISLGSL